VQSTTETSLAIEDVSHTFPASGKQAPVHALDHIDVRLAPGEFFSVIGPSGCGKSTLLEIVAGLIPATSGRIPFV